MLTLSTAHVTKETMKLIDEEVKNNRFLSLSVYAKEDFGWFIYLDKEAFTKFNRDCMDMPDDLKMLIDFAFDHGCDMLCLDGNGEELPYLRTYDHSVLVEPCPHKESKVDTMSNEEAIKLLQDAITESERIIEELKQAKDKAERVGMVGEYYSQLETCEKEIEACKMAISALSKYDECVAYGEWDRSPKDDMAVCKSCGYEHYLGSYHQYASNYCPECGLKMIRKGHDHNHNSHQPAVIPVSIIKQYLIKLMEDWDSLGERKYELPNMQVYNHVRIEMDKLSDYCKKNGIKM